MTEEVRRLIDLGAVVGAKDFTGKTALMDSAYDGRAWVVPPPLQNKSHIMEEKVVSELFIQGVG